MQRGNLLTVTHHLKQTILSSEKSRSPATAMVSNSRTKLRMKLLNVEKRDNIELYLCCKFQCSPFSVRCKADVTDGKIALQVLMPRGKSASWHT